MMRKMLIGACLFMMQTTAWAKVTLPEIMSDNMVLQQQTEACLWGKANTCAEVVIRPSWSREVYKVKPMLQVVGKQKSKLLKQVIMLIPYQFRMVKK